MRASSLLLGVIVAGCAPAAPAVMPPQNYNGPVAEEPQAQPNDFWIYQVANQTRVKATKLFEPIGFPLWIGKSWSYESEALLRGQPSTSKASRAPTQITCVALAFKEITVPAGTFNAFQCDCDCRVFSGTYDSSCGQWTLWYAPDARNVIRRDTESTATSMELIDYRGRRQPTKTPQKMVRQP